MSETNDSQIQMGALTSHVSVIDEDALLSPHQLDRIAEAVLAKLEQKLQNQQQRQADQSIGAVDQSNGGWPR